MRLASAQSMEPVVKAINAPGARLELGAGLVKIDLSRFEKSQCFSSTDIEDVARKRALDEHEFAPGDFFIGAYGQRIEFAQQRRQREKGGCILAFLHKPIRISEVMHAKNSLALSANGENIQTLF